MVYTALQSIAHKWYRKEKLLSNAVPISTKLCQYSLLARLKVKEKKMKINKRK